jgi:hypothetical protein
MEIPHAVTRTARLGLAISLPLAMQRKQRIL